MFAGVRGRYRWWWLLGIGFSIAHFLLHGTPNTAEQGRHTAPSSACSPLDSSTRNAVSDKAVIPISGISTSFDLFWSAAGSRLQRIPQ